MMHIPASDPTAPSAGSSPSSSPVFSEERAIMSTSTTPSSASSTASTAPALAVSCVPAEPRRSSWSHPEPETELPLCPSEEQAPRRDSLMDLRQIVIQPIPPFKGRSASSQDLTASTLGRKRPALTDEAELHVTSRPDLDDHDEADRPSSPELPLVASISHPSKRVKWDHQASTPMTALTSAAVEALNSLDPPATTNKDETSSSQRRYQRTHRTSFDAAALVAFRDSQMKELERRERLAATAASIIGAGGPRLDPMLSNALDKLKSNRQNQQQQQQQQQNDASSSSAAAAPASSPPSATTQSNATTLRSSSSTRRRPIKELKIATGPSHQAYFEAVNGPTSAHYHQQHHASSSSHQSSNEAGLSSAPLAATSQGSSHEFANSQVFVARGNKSASAQQQQYHHHHHHHGSRKSGAHGSGTKTLPTIRSPVIPTPVSSHQHNHHHHQQQHHQQYAMQQQQATPQSSTTSNTPMSASKASFLNLFSTFYDSLGDSRVLTTTLETQIARSASLINALHEARSSFVELVEDRVERAKSDWNKDVESVEKRLSRIEVMLGGKIEGDGLLDRLEAIEKRLSDGSSLS